MPTATLPRPQVEATARRPPAWLESSPPWLQDLWRRQVAAHDRQAAHDSLPAEAPQIAATGR